MKLIVLLGLFAMCAMAVSSPINEEKRTEEIVDLLREFLLLDAEEKQFGKIGSGPTLPSSVNDALNDFAYKGPKVKSYIAVRVEDDKWTVVDEGDEVTWSNFKYPSEDTRKAEFEKMKKNLTPSQLTFVLFKKDYYDEYCITWAPVIVSINKRMSFTSAVGELNGKADKVWDCTKMFKWETDADISVNIFN